MEEPHVEPWFLDTEVEECTEEIWEAIASLTRHTPAAIARGLFANLDCLLEALLVEGLCAPDEVQGMAARLRELAGATGGADSAAPP